MRERPRTRAGETPARDLALDTLVEVLDGRDAGPQPLLPRRRDGDHARYGASEFGYQIASFHHAVEAYKIADLLRDNGTCAAMWADWWGFKMEAYDAINENIPLVHNAGACAIVHSDDANGIQRLNQEAAKALADGRRMGIDISDEVAWTLAGDQPGQGARHRRPDRQPARRQARRRRAVERQSVQRLHAAASRSGSTAPCSTTRTIRGCGRSATSSSASRAKET